MNGKQARMLRKMGSVCGTGGSRPARALIRKYRSLPALAKGIIRRTYNDYCAARQKEADETGRMEWISPSLPRVMEMAGFYSAKTKLV